MELEYERTISFWLIILTFVLLWGIISLAITKVELRNVIDELHGKNYDTKGRYSQEQNVIIIYLNQMSTQDLQETAMHELCHHIWYNKIDYLSKLNYTLIHHEASYFVSDYARTSVNEDFAESCAYYVLGAEIDKERTAFMDKNIKNELIISR